MNYIFFIIPSMENQRKYSWPWCRPNSKSKYKESKPCLLSSSSSFLFLLLLSLFSFFILLPPPPSSSCFLLLLLLLPLPPLFWGGRHCSHYYRTGCFPDSTGKVRRYLEDLSWVPSFHVLGFPLPATPTPEDLPPSVLHKHLYSCACPISAHL